MEEYKFIKSKRKASKMSKIKEYHLKLDEEGTREERRKALFGRMFGDPIASKAYYSLKRKKRD
tara:strand:+ start:534 stop:722 length:189 start_codon:yes stop_codon:yes gene_type:complete